MIREQALAIAGEGAHLVARPAGVAHVYTGPLTPSGRFAPRAAKTVCRTRTRRLHVLPSTECQSSLSLHGVASPRLCARCTACLGRDRDRDQPRQATSSHRSRVDWIREYTGTSKADLAFALELATSPDEVDAAAWLSLLLFDVAGCNNGFTEHGREWEPLHQLVCAARARVHGYPEDRQRMGERGNAVAEAARADAASRRKADWQDREDRIRRLGFNAAVPARRRPLRP